MGGNGDGKREKGAPVCTYTGCTRALPIPRFRWRLLSSNGGCNWLGTGLPTFKSHPPANYGYGVSLVGLWNPVGRQICQMQG